MIFKKIILLLSTITLLLTGCKTNASMQHEQTDTSKNTEAFKTEETSSDETQQADTEALSQPEILHFVDALGGWHETEILPTVAKHNYNWEYLSNDGQNISYIGDTNYTIRKGIDVSYHQKTIDWEKVKADGYDFAFLRVGYRGYAESGKLMQDSAFATNIKNAQKAGIDVGVYFFAQAINEQEAMEEAEFVLNILKDYTLQLPVVYDPELIRDAKARTDDVTGEQFTKNTIIFCEAMKQAGFEPMIYSNMVWEATLFDMEQLQVYPFWYADYEKVPQTPYNFTFWQYSESGSVDGINGNTDLNVWFCPTN
ncbi:MAG: glycoside hydrolase family 25 protein [Lachnospiraceae bacterium]|nr:glycoside hydrolase family 25 protein [Lachnospiraceae bacterium]